MMNTKTPALTLAVSGPKSYIARITGRDPKFGLACDFIGQDVSDPNTGIYELKGERGKDTVRLIVVWKLDGVSIRTEINEAQAKSWCELKTATLTKRARAEEIITQESVLSNLTAKVARWGNGTTTQSRVVEDAQRVLGVADYCSYATHAAAVERYLGVLRGETPDRASVIRARLAEIAAEAAALEAELASLAPAAAE